MEMVISNKAVAVLSSGSGDGAYSDKAFAVGVLGLYKCYFQYLTSPCNSQTSSCNPYPPKLHPEPIVFFDLKSQNKNCFQVGAEVLIRSPNVKIYQEYIL
jgi:hypothetical protein